MPTTEEEMNNALDELEEEHGSLDEQHEEEHLEKRDNNLEEEQHEKERPPGFLNYEEWVEAGKDPADFRGENAYKAQYASIKEVRDLKSTMNHVVDGMQEWKQQQNEVMTQQIEQARIDAQAELDQAIEDDDTGAAILAKDKLHKIDKKPVPTQVNPIISDFASKNPVIDPQSTQYDAAFHQDMIMIHNGKLDQLLGGDRSRAGELTQEQIERVQKLAFTQAKELHPDKFVSSRNKRSSSVASKRRSNNINTNANSKLKDFNVNSKNSRDTNPASDIYEIIKAKDPKAAEKFAESLTGEK